MGNTYTQAKLARDALEQANIAADKALKAIPGINSGPMGLTPDSVKSSDVYKAAKRDFDTTWQALRDFNSAFVRKYKKEIAADRKARAAIAKAQVAVWPEELALKAQREANTRLKEILNEYTTNNTNEEKK